MREALAAAAALSPLLLLACGGGPPSSPGSSTSGGSLVFKASPLELSTIRQIVPLGNLNPPGHTLPTDHIYVNNRTPNGAPANRGSLLGSTRAGIKFYGGL